MPAVGDDVDGSGIAEGSCCEAFVDDAPCEELTSSVGGREQDTRGASKIKVRNRVLIIYFKGKY